MNTKQLNKIVLKVMCYFYSPPQVFYPLSVRPSVRLSVRPSVRNTLAAEKLKNRLC